MVQQPAVISERKPAHDIGRIPRMNSINKVHKLVGVLDELCHHAAFIDIYTTFMPSRGYTRNGWGWTRDRWKPK